MDRRDSIIDILTKEFIGPDPIDRPGLIQENGEEILSSDPPRIRYIAGVLFPQKSKSENVIVEDDSEEVTVEEEGIATAEDNFKSLAKETIDDAEEMINLSNAYQQSAISLTAAVVPEDSVFVSVTAGVYESHKDKDEKTGKDKKKYYRIPLNWNNDNNPIPLPNKDNRSKKTIIKINGKSTYLAFVVTYRYSVDDVNIFTFTLENAKINKDDKVRDEECYFQVGFSITSKNGFHALHENSRININDNDYSSNQMMYRNIKTYAIGHGCSVEWDDNEPVSFITTKLIPSYEMKPIVPTKFDDVSLSMYEMSDYGKKESIVSNLTLLCDKYEQWIENLVSQAEEIPDKLTAERHINNCKKCLARMRKGVKILQSNDDVLLAFQLMNRAMLLQQLHYNLPLQTWEIVDKTPFLSNPVQLPDINNKETWYDKENRVYGIWRPFQLAFVLINLESMLDINSEERKIVDLIWFPTGGGKTEAYLGLSAYTIFIRRLKNKDDEGTAILMRYTLRLLTSQQYDRASSMICACEIIRRQFEDRLGSSRITIGLWVGEGTTPNSMQKAVKAFIEIYNTGETNVENNPMVVLKCPWCGAQMGVIKEEKKPYVFGYKKKPNRRKKSLILRCSNDKHGCDFANDSFALPLQIIDEDIYNNPPTLLLGTVDKFAMLPYRPEAQTIFGIHNGTRKTAPDLIIQDELHLISGPLGSTVGHYETMIHELCSYEKEDNLISPKVIASTATISRADEQCRALYGCAAKDVMQFPPSGLDAGNSFFAKEDKNADGRRYVGIFTPNSSSVATTMIRLYATLCYAAKKIDVEDESERDAYWTNIGYFNSIRELGQAQTWIHADISEYLQVIYKRRYEDKEEGYKEKRRYLYNDIELTSRVSSDKIPYSLQALGYKYSTNKDDPRPVDICLATNMVSVGVDVPRLGLMTVAGQPKTTSEYIQATSRVGRNAKDAPGLVVTVYNPGKPRDRSHYEHFKSYHSKVYCNVEPTSVTPFSPQLRERALHAIIVGILRLENDEDYNTSKPEYPDKTKREYIKDILAERINDIDPDELEKTLLHIDAIFRKWKNWEPEKFCDFSGGVDLPLLFPAGSMRNNEWGDRGFPAPTSMRNVDASCEAYVLENDYVPEED